MNNKVSAIVYNARERILSKQKIDFDSDIAIGDILDIDNTGTNMYMSLIIQDIFDGQRYAVFYNSRVDWKDKENYSPIGFKGEVFNNIIIVFAYNAETMLVEDIKMTTNDAYHAVKGFDSSESGWETIN